MVSRAEVNRLRSEADTTMPRYEGVQKPLETARSESGDHWETGELGMTLQTPGGEAIEIALDLDCDPSTSAQERYERPRELEAELDRKVAIVGQLVPMPADAVAYLLCQPRYCRGELSRSATSHFDAERD